MKILPILAFSAAATLVSPAAFPCGAPFGTGINVDPKQDIVVVHKNGIETYVFQPRFCGTASEFGLILPIPTPLSSAPALSWGGVFSKLVSLSQPEYRTETVCRKPRGDGGMYMDASAAVDRGGAVVVSTGSAGFMDYTQLKADSTASFTDWLDKNGYPYDSLAQGAFSYYVEKGWYFLAFKISQGAAASGATVCKDLGPVKLSFPSAVPVVPTRMATARKRDTTDYYFSYAPNFSWRIFGITTATEQIGFTEGGTSRRTLGYSGLLKDVDYLDGLAEVGDRLDKLTVTFDYGSTDPDIAFSLVPGTDYREVITAYSYVTCSEADAALPKSDSAPADSTPRQPDSEIASPSSQDAGVATDPAVLADASVPVNDTPDAGKPMNGDQTDGRRSGGGCSMASGPAGHVLASLLLFALMLALRRRRG